MELFGCTTPFGDNLDHICTEPNKSAQAYELFDSLRTKTSIKECLYPCRFLRTKFLGMTHDEGGGLCGGKSCFVLLFDEFIKVSEAKYSYTELELLAEVGGYVGLFLGVSVFHLSSTIHKIIKYALKLY